MRRNRWLGSAPAVRWDDGMRGALGMSQCDRESFRRRTNPIRASPKLMRAMRQRTNLQLLEPLPNHRNRRTIVLHAALHEHERCTLHNFLIGRDERLWHHDVHIPMLVL